VVAQGTFDGENAQNGLVLILFVRFLVVARVVMLLRLVGGFVGVLLELLVLATLHKAAKKRFDQAGILLLLLLVTVGVVMLLWLVVGFVGVVRVVRAVRIMLGFLILATLSKPEERGQRVRAVFLLPLVLVRVMMLIGLLVASLMFVLGNRGLVWLVADSSVFAASDWGRECEGQGGDEGEGY